MNFSPNMVFLNRSFDKKRLKALLLWFRLNLSEGAALEAVEILQGLGFRSATQGAISLGLDDLKTPTSKNGRVFQAQLEVALAHHEHHRGNRTPVELFQHLVDTWHRTSQDLTTEVVQLFRSTERVNPVYMMAFSGARGNLSQVRQLVGMRGLMADPRGQIVGFPILSNFREGLTITEYFVSCYGARKGVVDTAIRTADAGYLTRRLADVSHHFVVRTTNCGTHRTICLTDIKEGQKTILPLASRLVGRVLGEHIPQIAFRNQEITPDLASKLASQCTSLQVRSPLSCSLRWGVCQLCYGWGLSEGRRVTLGEAVGIIAAQSIGEPGTQLTLRTFHTGGVFSGDLLNEIRSPYNGTVFFPSPLQGLLVRTPHGQIAFLTKVSGKMILSFCRLPSNQSNLFRNIEDVTHERVSEASEHISSALTVVAEGKPQKEGTLGIVNDADKLFVSNADAMHAQPPEEGASAKLFSDQVQKENTEFSLQPSTVIFVRQKEQVTANQLLAEFSSSTLQPISDQIEVTQQVLSESAGQVWFKEIEYGNRKGPGSGSLGTHFSSQKLGGVWVLAGKPRSEILLNDRQHFPVNSTNLANFRPALLPALASLTSISQNHMQQSSSDYASSCNNIEDAITQQCLCTSGALPSSRLPLRAADIMQPSDMQGAKVSSTLHQRFCISDAQHSGVHNVYHDDHFLKYHYSLGYSQLITFLFAEKREINFVYLRFANSLDPNSVKSVFNGPLRECLKDGSYKKGFACLYTEGVPSVVSSLHLFSNSCTFTPKGVLGARLAKLNDSELDSTSFANLNTVYGWKTYKYCYHPTSAIFITSGLCYFDRADSMQSYASVCIKDAKKMQNIFLDKWQKKGVDKFSLLIDSQRRATRISKSTVISSELDATLGSCFSSAPSTVYNQPFQRNAIKDSRFLQTKVTEGKRQSTVIRPDKKADQASAEISLAWGLQKERKASPGMLLAEPFFSSKEYSEGQVFWLSSSFIQQKRFLFDNVVLSNLSFSSANLCYMVQSHSLCELKRLPLLSHSQIVSEAKGQCESRCIVNDSCKGSQRQCYDIRNANEKEGAKTEKRQRLAKLNDRCNPVIKKLIQTLNLTGRQYSATNRGIFSPLKQNSTFGSFTALLNCAQIINGNEFLQINVTEGKRHTDSNSLGELAKRRLPFPCSSATPMANDCASSCNNIEDVITQQSLTFHLFWQPLSLANYPNKIVSQASESNSTSPIRFTNRRLHQRYNKVVENVPVEKTELRFFTNLKKRKGEKSGVFVQKPIWLSIHISNNNLSPFFSSNIKEKKKKSRQIDNRLEILGKKKRVEKNDSSLDQHVVHTVNLPIVSFPYLISSTDHICTPVNSHSKGGADSLHLRLGICRLQCTSGAKVTFQIKDLTAEHDGLRPFPTLRYISPVPSKTPLSFPTVGKPIAVGCIETANLRFANVNQISDLKEACAPKVQRRNPLKFGTTEKKIGEKEWVIENYKKRSSCSFNKKVDSLLWTKGFLTLTFSKGVTVLSKKQVKSAGRTYYHSKCGTPTQGGLLPLIRQSFWEEAFFDKSFPLDSAVFYTKGSGYICIGDTDRLCIKDVKEWIKNVAGQRLPFSTRAPKVQGVNSTGNIFKEKDFRISDIQFAVYLPLKIISNFQGRYTSAHLALPENNLVSFAPLTNKPKRPNSLCALKSTLGAKHKGAFYTEGVQSSCNNIEDLIKQMHVPGILHTCCYRLMQRIVEYPAERSSFHRWVTTRRRKLQYSSFSTSLINGIYTDGMALKFKKVCAPTLQSFAPNLTKNFSFARSFHAPSFSFANLSSDSKRDDNNALPIRNKVWIAKNKFTSFHGATFLDWYAFPLGYWKSSLLFKDASYMVNRSAIRLPLHNAPSFQSSIGQQRVVESCITTTLPFSKKTPLKKKPSFVCNRSLPSVTSKGCAPKVQIRLAKLVHRRCKDEPTDAKQVHRVPFLSESDQITFITNDETLLSNSKKHMTRISIWQNRSEIFGHLPWVVRALKVQRLYTEGARVQGSAPKVQRKINDRCKKKNASELHSHFLRPFGTSWRLPCTFGAQANDSEFKKVNSPIALGFYTHEVGLSIKSAFSEKELNFFTTFSSWKTKTKITNAKVYQAIQSFFLPIKVAFSGRVEDIHTIDQSNQKEIVVRAHASQMQTGGECFHVQSSFTSRNNSPCELDSDSTALLIRGVRLPKVNDSGNRRLETPVTPTYTYLYPGQLVTYGEKMDQKVATTESGQVLYLDSQRATLRKAQTVLIYSQAILSVLSGEWIKKSTPLMALSYQKLVTGDIVQGLPKIEQFFEAPLLKDGTFWSDSLQAKLNLFFQEHRGKFPLAEAVRKGFSDIQRVLVEGVQRVYISQGVLIADKHLEVIVRQMTCKGRILYSGDTGFLRNELVALDKIESVNQVTYGQKALYHPQVRGITDASLESESFLSAASFQETTRVLSRDAVIGKTDLMRGLKERVIVGELIQAGTGLTNNSVYSFLLD